MNVYICKMYILAELKEKLQNIKIYKYKGTKTTFDFFQNNTFLFFDIKDFILVKRIFWQISSETVENQDLYRNKDDF